MCRYQFSTASWNKGIQIRTNLDILETWASQQGVTKEAIRHLQQLSAAADLLASPKQALLQVLPCLCARVCVCVCMCVCALACVRTREHEYVCLCGSDKWWC